MSSNEVAPESASPVTETLPQTRQGDSRTMERVPASEARPERIGQYQLVRPLGRGGMGEIWLALREEADFRHHVALKIVRSGLETAELVAAFRAERQILASLNHPNIAHLLDVGQTRDGRPYLALEFVEGLPLNEYCDQRHLTIDERLRLFCTVCEAVRFAHQNLVVHQDLKPSNILVTAAGIPKLLDFGIAKVLSPETNTAPNTASVPIATPEPLTPEYAAPEQIEGAPTTTASDVYALGVVLYQLLTSRLPYQVRGERAAVLRQIREAPPPAPSKIVDASMRGRLAGDIDAIVLRAMGRTVAERYSSVEQLAADIERSLALEPVTARRRTMTYVAGRFISRYRLGAAVVATSIVLLTGFIVTALRQSDAIRDRLAQVDSERRRAVAVSSFLEGLFRGADPTKTLGDTISARGLLDRGAARVERELAGDPATQADLMMVMSQIYQNLELYQRAESLSAKAIANLRARGSGDDSTLAASLIAHGTALHFVDRGKDAVTDYESALAIRRRLGDTASRIVAQTLAYEGSVYQDQRNDSTAETLYRRSIAIERARGDVASDTTLAFALSSLGSLYLRKKDPARAVELYTQALAIRRARFSAGSPVIATSLVNLAVALEAAGDRAGAIQRYREALAIRLANNANDASVTDINAALNRLSGRR